MNSVLITGGSGSFGRACTAYLLAQPTLQRLRILSRDEAKQEDMARQFVDPRLDFFLGDVRDGARLRRAFSGVDTVIHAAALKRVPACEYNPAEAVKTNVLGALNVIEAALDAGVQKVIALSTDKAASPINLYGATKLVAEKLFVDANSYAGATGTRFAVVRYGNVMGSRGSVLQVWREAVGAGRPLPLTHPEMTRFVMTLQDAVCLVMTAARLMRGGECFIPALPGHAVSDLARAYAGESYPIAVTGIRPGEKLAESLLTELDVTRVVRAEGVYVVPPLDHDWAPGDSWGEPNLPVGFVYRSDTVPQLSVTELRRLLQDEGWL